jgi:uncharacterized membrane protein (UPF0136 family)
MKKRAYITFGYAFLVFSGGIMGFLFAKSIPSLVSGVLFGLLIAYNAYRMTKDIIKAQTLAMLQALVLALFFFYRYNLTHQIFPALAMTLVSSLQTLFLFVSHPRFVKKNK